jgi:hypothetical protein
MKKSRLRFTLIILIGLISPMAAQVPQLINYQGRVAVNGTNFDGTGQFKFALVDGGTVNTPPVSTATATATSSFGFFLRLGLLDYSL